MGDPVVKDEPLVELETDKVTVEIAAPASGTLIEVLKAENAEVNPDEVLARLRLPRRTRQRSVTSRPRRTRASRGLRRQQRRLRAGGGGSAPAATPRAMRSS